ncbi:SGNH/GDSL hydrolase family protein [Flaviflexus huanghaiensis]|uniref:SGNH/GDSL hydrolase family protein n=1 Tax=Flaviflexus huanghaiensis TaxID=1111473 RepID=UPI0015FCAB81|nr:SGNH/GDSL hydrolase family protein [Flaviflexus huanghaiensis]
MGSVRSRGLLAIIGLIILGLLAVSLSLAALASGRGAATSDATEARSFDFGNETSSDSHISTEPAVPSADPEVETETSVPAPDASLTAVIVGDSNSLGDPQSLWVGPVSAELEWDPLYNLSAPGRGYVTPPRVCNDSPCTPFPGTVDAIAEFSPEVVVTFGGVADGDTPLTEVAAQYYTDLRAALPEARIIAVAPIYSADSVPDWAPLHRASIQAAVESVGGVYVDAGQPALGDGEAMGAEAHAELAATLIAVLEP